MLATAVWWSGVLHGATETDVEGADRMCEGLGDRLFERTRTGVSGGRGKEEAGVEGVDVGGEE